MKIIILLLIRLSVSIDVRCGAYQGSVCEYCYDGYLQNGSCVEPSTKIENCKTYSNSSTCQQCVWGYQITSGG